MKLTGKCNCSEKLICGCTLSFSSYIASSTSVLDVGTLQGGSCSFAEYVIDWYRNGVHAMVSGIGNDPDIQTFHPFTGTGAVPVPSGTWVPVIRYVVLQGQSDMIFIEPKKCNKWCDFDISSLPVIAVSSIYCGLKGAGVNKPASIYYDYRISYSSSQDYTLAHRTIYFSLDSTSKYFAFLFTAYTVADRIQIFHSSDLNTPISDWIIGNESFSSYGDAMPYRYRSTSHKILLELPPSTSNDYLVINIIPSVITGIVTTDWILDMRCFNNTYSLDFTPYIQPPIGYDITTLAAMKDEPNCRYLFNMDLLSPTMPPINTSSLFYFAGGAGSNSVSLITIPINYKLQMAQTTRTSSSSVYTKVTSAGNITITKTGSIITVQCAAQSDYDVYKTSYNVLMAGYFYTGWNPDSTFKEYYRYFLWTVDTVINQCGEDGATSQTLAIFITSQFTFNDATKTITINLQSITSNYPVSSDPCNTSHTLPQSFTNNINLTVAKADFTLTTRCRTGGPFGIGYMCASITAGATFGSNSTSHYFMHYRSLPHYEILIDTWTFTGVYLGRTSYNARVTITAPRDPATFAYLKDPLENYRITWYIHPITGASITINIYEIIDNVVTTYIPFDELINHL